MRKQTLTLDGKKEEQIWPNEKWKPELCILITLKMKDDNLSDDKSSLQASVLVFFILSTKSDWAILSRTFTVLVSWLTGHNRLMKTEVGFSELYDQYVIDFDIDFKSH